MIGRDAFRTILDDMVDHVLKTTRDTIMREGRHMPLMWMLKSSGDSVMYWHPEASEGEKEANARLFVDVIKECERKGDEVLALIDVQEAWMAEVDERVPEHGELPARLHPANRRDSEECLIVTVETYGRMQVHHREIIRDEEGRIADLGEDRVFDDVEGPFCNLLHELG